MSQVPPFGGQQSHPMDRQPQMQYQPQAQPSYQPQISPPSAPEPSKGGFVSGLFDFSFQRFITRQAMSFIWGMTIAIHGLVFLASVAQGVLGLVAYLNDEFLAPINLFVSVISIIGTALSLIFWRLVFEFLVVQHHQADLLHRIEAKS